MQGHAVRYSEVLGTLHVSPSFFSTFGCEVADDEQMP